MTGTCDVCNVAYEAASSMDHCAVEGRCWEHCTSFVGHQSPALYDEDEPPMIGAFGPLHWDEDGDRAYDAAADAAVLEAIEAGEPENWRAYMRTGGA